MNDLEILQAAYRMENHPKTGALWQRDGWSARRIGADRQDVERLADKGLVQLVNQSRSYRSFRLTDKGLGVVAPSLVERAALHISAAEVLEAFRLIVGYDDLKHMIASAIEAQGRTHFLLEGPPASAKSLVLEGIREVVPTAYLAFGSRTSAAGLSDLLFERQPSILLLDEADKMRFDVYAVLLGLMEHSQVIETKTKKTRGIRLETMVIAACNSSAKMPREFLSRFALHAKFPPYSRDAFIAVSVGFLSRHEGCDAELARVIGQTVYDYGLGDVRKARAVWELMAAPTVEEMRRVVGVMVKYSGDKPAAVNGRLVGI